MTGLPPKWPITSCCHEHVQHECKTAQGRTEHTEPGNSRRSDAGIASKMKVSADPFSRIADASNYRGITRTRELSLAISWLLTLSIKLLDSTCLESTGVSVVAHLVVTVQDDATRCGCGRQLHQDSLGGWKLRCRRRCTGLGSTCKTCSLLSLSHLCRAAGAAGTAVLRHRSGLTPWPSPPKTPFSHHCAPLQPMPELP